MHLNISFIAFNFLASITVCVFAIPMPPHSPAPASSASSNSALSTTDKPSPNSHGSTPVVYGYWFCSEQEQQKELCDEKKVANPQLDKHMQEIVQFCIQESYKLHAPNGPPIEVIAKDHFVLPANMAVSGTMTVFFKKTPLWEGEGHVGITIGDPWLSFLVNFFEGVDRDNLEGKEVEPRYTFKVDDMKFELNTRLLKLYAGKSSRSRSS
ncbi:hypothetical protein EV360DRAFT_72046 [Lentinula raphanica]|nr:hypothetical protein EV360DRAFT_72046 [Lentinula raphanica]